MTNYAKELPNKSESEIEWNYPGGMPDLTEDNAIFITETMDPYFQERERVSSTLKNVFIDPFTIAYKKFCVLKKINATLEERIKNRQLPSDVVMLMLYEDSVKYWLDSRC